ncbi:MAG TPA: ABC transporter ATP-binding protein [Actinomycetota bacterium]|nr:ABC transporter ATP-binding protein [Actinomycetota bacterium]
MPNPALTAPPTTLRRGADDVAVRGLRKSFGTTSVLRGVDLTVAPGSVVALLGPSGCGKTTLLRAIAGLERPDAGTIEVGGRVLGGDGVHVVPEKRRVGMVFQDWALFPHLSVGANVAFGLPRRERGSERVAETLAMVGLSGLADRMPSTLSGGQQQRVALARALANRPSVILLDEPFSNLDASLRHQIRLEVQRLLADLGVTSLFVTHQQEEAFVVGQEVAVMLDGAVVQQGSPTELYEAPRTIAVARFVGDANFLRGAADADKAETCIGPVPLDRDHSGDVDVMVRPEQVGIYAGDDATVERVEFYGHDSIYLVATDRGPVVRSRVLAAPQFRAGDRVALGFTGRPAVAFPVAA